MNIELHFKTCLKMLLIELSNVINKYIIAGNL